MIVQHIVALGLFLSLLNSCIKYHYWFFSFIYYIWSKTKDIVNKFQVYHSPKHPLSNQPVFFMVPFIPSPGFHLHSEGKLRSSVLVQERCLSASLRPDERYAEMNPAQVTFYHCDCTCPILPQREDMQAQKDLFRPLCEICLLLWGLLFRDKTIIYQNLSRTQKQMTSFWL